MVRGVLKERLDCQVKSTIVKEILRASTVPQPFVQDIYDFSTNASNVDETGCIFYINVRGTSLALTHMLQRFS
jgi:hypothetical protein